MIIEWLVSVGSTIAIWFQSLLPVFDIPDWFGQVGVNVNKFFVGAQGLQPFVDWNFLAIIISVPLGLWGVGLLFRLGRMLLSHIPFFGGR